MTGVRGCIFFFSFVQAGSTNHVVCVSVSLSLFKKLCSESRDLSPSHDKKNVVIEIHLLPFKTKQRILIGQYHQIITNQHKDKLLQRDTTPAGPANYIQQMAP